MLTNKIVEVLLYIMNQPKDVTLQELTKIFNLSERSIRYYIQDINYEIPNAISINKRICKVSNQIDIEKYIESYQSLQYSSEMKKMLVLYHIIFHGFINLTTFSNTLDISRSSVKAYVEDIRKDLQLHHIKLIPTHKLGLIIQGSEENIRQIQLQHLLDYEQLSITNKKILSPILDAYVKDIDISQIDKFLTKIQKELSFVLTDLSYNLIANYAKIMMQRIKEENILSTCDNVYFLETCCEYSVISRHISGLQKDVTKYPFEILHMTSLIIGAHYSKSSNILENNWFEHDLLVSKIIALYSRYYGVNLNYDRPLYESLLTHLRPTLYRMMNNIPFYEVDYEDIKNKFPHEYEIMCKVVNELKFFTDEDLYRNEIALLTIHFKAALQRNEHTASDSKRILIVCSHGYGTSKLLEQQLVDTYDIEVLDCLPYHCLKQYTQLDKVDFIITTIDTFAQYKNIPVLLVHPILNALDIQKLDYQFLMRRKPTVQLSLVLDAIKKSCTIHEFQELKHDLHIAIGNTLLKDDVHSQTLLDILSLQNIKLNYHAENWQDAITLAGELLVKNGYVCQEYQKQMLGSFENYGSYMIIDEGIAIPHTKNEGTVFKTGMTLVTLEKPVLFNNGKELCVFFAFCSKDNIEHLDALMALANLIRETNFKEELPKFKSAEDVLHYLKKQHIQ